MDYFVPEDNSSVIVEKKKAVSTIQFSMGKVLLWFAIGLLITGVVSLVMPDILIAIANASSAESAFTGYTIALVVSGIVMMVSMVVINIKSLSKNVGVSATFYVLYSLSMGVLLSSIFMMLMAELGDSKTFIRTVAVSFLVSAGCFLLMGILGAVFKKSVNILIPVAMTLGVGTLVLVLVNIFLQSNVITWVVDFVVLAYILLLTAVDMGRVKKLADSGIFTNANALAIAEAATLYTDFILIFIKLLGFIAAANKNN